MSATGLTHLAALLRQVSPVNVPRGDDIKWRFLPAGLYLVGALLVAAFVIALAGRWRRAPRSVTTTASEQLTEFRLLYEKGQMSREEFDRVRARLTSEIRGAEAARGPQPATPAETPPSTPPTTTPPAAGPHNNGSGTPPAAAGPEAPAS